MSAPTLKRASNGTIYVHWTENRRSKRVSTRTADMAEAKAFLAQWLLLEQSVAPVCGDRTVSECWTAYYNRHVLAECASVSTAEWSWKNLDLHFGALHVSEITADVIDQYLAKRRAGKIGKPSADSTIRRELVNLRSALNWCASPKRKLLDPSVVPLFDLPKDGDPRDRWLRTGEIQALLAAASDTRVDGRLSRCERFLWLALETAARSEAIRQLTWDRVDFEVGVIDYNVPGRRKTKKRRAVVPISKTLMPVLERAYRERKGDSVLDSEAPVYDSVKRAASRASLEDVSPNVLRHTAATHMARNGTPLWLVAKILGNSIAMVERVYAKHCPDDLRPAVENISTSGLELAE